MYLYLSLLFFLFPVALFKIVALIIISPITIKIPSIPFPIYGSVSIKACGLKLKKFIHRFSFHQAKKLRISPPAITEAI